MKSATAPVAALTLSSVVIGVMSVVAVTLTTGSTRSAFDAAFHAVTGRSSLEISGPIGTTFSESLLAQIDAVDGVKAANPIILRRSVIYGHNRRIQSVVMGIELERDRAVHDYTIVAGTPPENENDVLVNESVAKLIGIAPGEEIEMLARRGLMKVRVAGLYAIQGTLATTDGAALLLPIRFAQHAFKAPGRLDKIQLVLNPNANNDAVGSKIVPLLPANVAIERPAARSLLAEETSLSTETALVMALAFSVLVALFVITNTFLISVTQRRRQIGIIRAFGATRVQVALIVYGEAFVLGVAGTIIGLIAGVVCAKYLNLAMGLLYGTTLPPARLGIWPLIYAAVFGIGTSILGAALPARKASRISPGDAMRDVLPDEMEGMSRWFVIGGVALILLSAVLVLMSATQWLPVAFGVWGAVVMLIGLVLVLPLGLAPLSRSVSVILRPLLRVESRLARRQLLRHRARTTLTTGVVFIAVSTGIGLATAVVDNVQDVRNWYRKVFVADFFIRAMVPEMSSGLMADLPDELDTKLHDIPGITSIEALRLVNIKAGDQTAVLLARDFLDGNDLEFDLKQGEPGTIRDQLHEGRAIVGSVLATRLDLKVGDELPLVVGGTVHPLRIAAIANDYQAGGLTVYIDRGVARRLFGIEGIDVFVIKSDKRLTAAVRTRLEELCKEYGLMLDSFSDIHQSIDKMMTGVVAGLWCMVALGFIVASFGIANTLTMTVLEQTRELGLLRILSMTRAQVRKTILAQAIIMGLLAIVPGIVAGIGVSYLINQATLSEIGHVIQFNVHFKLIVGASVGAMLTVLAAAWLPAERAARLELPQVLRQT